MFLVLPSACVSYNAPFDAECLLAIFLEVGCVLNGFKNPKKFDITLQERNFKLRYFVFAVFYNCEVV